MYKRITDLPVISDSTAPSPSGTTSVWVIAHGLVNASSGDVLTIQPQLPFPKRRCLRIGSLPFLSPSLKHSNCLSSLILAMNWNPRLHNAARLPTAE